MKNPAAHIADTLNWASFYVQFHGANSEVEAFKFFTALPKFVKAGYTPKANYVTLELKLADGMPSSTGGRRAERFLQELDEWGIPLVFREGEDRPAEYVETFRSRVTLAA